MRLIEAKDDPQMGRIIRQVMTEFNAVGEGYSIQDPEVDAMTAAYSDDRAAYFVIENSSGQLVGGAGYAQLAGADTNTCELRKMYLIEGGRGAGLGRILLETCLEGARQDGYQRCYLETLDHMTSARRLYEANGFKRINKPLGATGHFGCDAWYELPLVSG